jgi:hypothetical protein
MVKLNGLVVAVAVAVGGALAAQTASQNEQGDESMTRRIEVYSVELGKNVTVDVVEVPDDEWRKRLTDEHTGHPPARNRAGVHWGAAAQPGRGGTLRGPRQRPLLSTTKSTREAAAELLRVGRFRQRRDRA